MPELNSFKIAQKQLDDAAEKLVWIRLPMNS